MLIVRCAHHKQRNMHFGVADTRTITSRDQRTRIKIGVGNQDAAIASSIHLTHDDIDRSDDRRHVGKQDAVAQLGQD